MNMCGIYVYIYNTIFYHIYVYIYVWVDGNYVQRNQEVREGGRRLAAHWVVRESLSATSYYFKQSIVCADQ